jgi:A/G-specific adenine glycosylase
MLVTALVYHAAHLYNLLKPLFLCITFRYTDVVTKKAFQKTIVDYYTKNKRTFPWRLTHDPYSILVSEIMLQQTQTDRVVPKYENWLQHFPTFEALAAAPLQRVLTHWHGLGYNSRALRLKKAAEEVVKNYGGKLPAEYEKIVDLPGIGPYTAGAVMAFAFNKPFPIIETNIRTVYIHFYFKDHGQIHDKEILELVANTLPDHKSLPSITIRDWYYALMDYGVMLKKTIGNLSQKSRHYTKQSTFKGSNRELRAKVLRLITAKPVSQATICKTLDEDSSKIGRILAALESEGFIKKEKTVYCIH